MRLMDWMMEGAFDISEVPFRHSRVGLPRRMVWTLMGLLAAISFFLLLGGAIVTAIVFTEVRPPTADENYQRYLGSDYRRNIGPLMMISALIIFTTGLICLFGRKVSHREDKKQMALLQDQLYQQQSQAVQPQRGQQPSVHQKPGSSQQSLETN